MEPDATKEISTVDSAAQSEDRFSYLVCPVDFRMRCTNVAPEVGGRGVVKQAVNVP